MHVPSRYRASNRYYARAPKESRPAGGQSVRADILDAMGRNHFALKEYKEAARLFEQLLRESPGRPAEPDVMLSPGRTLLAQDRKPDAHRILRTLADRYSDAPESAEALQLISGQKSSEIPDPGSLIADPESFIANPAS